LNKMKPVATVAILVMSVCFWLLGLFNSSTLDPDIADQTYQVKPAPDDSARAEQQRRLAEAYWSRYPDIRTHHYFGEDGPLGVNGAWEHYRQHGRFEGRMFWSEPEISRQETEDSQAE